MQSSSSNPMLLTNSTSSSSKLLGLSGITAPVVSRRAIATATPPFGDFYVTVRKAQHEELPRLSSSKDSFALVTCAKSNGRELQGLTLVSGVRLPGLDVGICASPAARTAPLANFDYDQRCPATNKLSDRTYRNMLGPKR